MESKKLLTRIDPEECLPWTSGIEPDDIWKPYHDARIAHEQREVIREQQEVLKKVLALWDRHFSRALLKVMREPERISYYELETKIHTARALAAPFLEN